MLRVVDRTCRTGEVEDVIHLAAIERLVDVDLLEFESRVVAQVFEVGLRPVSRLSALRDGVAFASRASHKMGAQESSTAGDQGAFRVIIR